MTPKEWFMALFGRSPVNDDPAHTTLDAHQNQIAGRLSRLTGKRRDEVLAEAYRRADKILSGKQ